MKQLSPITHVLACKPSSILVLGTVTLLCTLSCMDHVLAWHTSYLLHMYCGHSILMTLRVSQVLCICQLMTGESAQNLIYSYPHTNFPGVSPSCFMKTHFSSQEIPLSWPLFTAILVSALCCSVAGLMPCCSHSFVTCSYCSLDMEFQTDWEHFLNSTFPEMHHFGLSQLTPSIDNMDRLQIVAIFDSHLTKV